MFRKLRKKLKDFDEFQVNGLIQLAYDYSSNDKKDLMNCYKCGHSLGLWKMVFHAMQVERGKLYRVKCKYCKSDNLIRRRKRNEL